MWDCAQVPKPNVSNWQHTLTTAPQERRAGLSRGGSQAARPLTSGWRKPAVNRRDLNGGAGATRLIPEHSAAQHGTAFSSAQLLRAASWIPQLYQVLGGGLMGTAELGKGAATADSCHHALWQPWIWRTTTCLSPAMQPMHKQASHSILLPPYDALQHAGTRAVAVSR